MERVMAPVTEAGIGLLCLCRLLLRLCLSLGCDFLIVPLLLRDTLCLLCFGCLLCCLNGHLRILKVDSRFGYLRIYVSVRKLLEIIKLVAYT